MRVAICDDDASIRDHYSDLIKLIAEQNDFTVLVDRFEKGAQLLFAMEDKRVIYDIIFLDIFMPGKNGIDLGSSIRKTEHGSFVVYLTRSTDHMLPAFDVGASNYILKGNEFADDRFEKVFLKTVEEVEKRKRKYILLNNIEEHRNVAIDTIKYFEVSRHICIVHYGKDERFEFTSSLGKLENMLMALNFERVHKSFLVNCRKVKSYTVREITMHDDSSIPVGRKYLATFRQAMSDLAEINVGAAQIASEQ